MKEEVNKWTRHLYSTFDAARSKPGMNGLLHAFVDLKDTIRSFKGIVAGEYDHLPEAGFYMVGPIEEAVAKAEKMAADA